MSTPEKLDEFLRGKLEGRSFDFKEAYWDAAEKAILAEEAARKRRRRLFFFFLFFLAGGGLSATFFTFTDSLKPRENTLSRLSTHSPVPYSQPIKHATTLEIIEEICDESRPVFTANTAAYRKKNTISGEFAPSGRVVLSGKEKEPPHALAQEGTLPGQSFRQIFSSVNTVRPWHKPLSPEINDSLFYKHSDPGIPLHRRNYFGFTFGNNISPGFRNTRSARAPLSVSPVLGIRYAYAVSPSFRLQTGLNYQSRGGLNADSTYRSVEYAFGTETMATTISPQTLHYLEIPFLADIRLSGRHYLTAGVNLSFLANTRSKVHKQQILPFETQDLGTTREWGYKQGFKPLDINLTAGYGYYLGQGIRVGVQGNYGLRDITDEKFFLNTTPDRNLQLRLVLEYDLVHF
ncbi:MAG: porin family protein [Bacteroidia bacterium]|nr:porin family protein [Bacteroidia bacterium]